MSGNLGAILIFTIIILTMVFVIRMILDAIGNKNLSTVYKVVWVLFILAAPLLGATAYFVIEK